MKNARNIAGRVIGHCLTGSGLVAWNLARVGAAGSVTNVYFHRPSRSVFAGCMTWLLQRGFNIVSTRQLEEALGGGRPLRPLSAHVSLDDGWRSNLTEVVPVARSLNIPVTIFIPAEPILAGTYWWTDVARQAGHGHRTIEHLKRVPDAERRKFLSALVRHSDVPREAMTLEELQAIARLDNVEIGSHTVTHPILTQCTDEVLAQELEASKSTLEDWLGMPVRSFAYPNGDVGDREVAAVRKAGYTLAFTTVQRHACQTRADLLRLPRLALPNDTSLPENIARMTGMWYVL